MVSIETFKPKKNIMYLLGMLVLVLVLGFQPSESAQTQAPYPDSVPVQGPGACFKTMCFQNQTPQCGANDVRIARLDTYETIKACRYVGDTGIYSFKAQFVAGANERYDPTVWIASDGGDALTGSCYMDYLNPITSVKADEDLVNGFGPFPNLESTVTPTDKCGDIRQNEITYKIIGPMQIYCSAGLLNNQELSTVIGWDVNTNHQCTSGRCPDQQSKCKSDAAIVTINNLIVDLAITKVAPTIPVFPGDEFTYSLTVNNKSSINTSTGYTITDLLPSGLSFVSSLPDVCTSKVDTVTLRDKVTCVVENNLPFGQTASPIQLTVKLSESYKGSFPITNQACVVGNEPEYDGSFPQPNPPASTLGDNCDDDNVITEVDLISFTAHAQRSAILVEWETASEKDNLGFNLYRATSPGGERIKLNTTLIPSNDPGGNLGSKYAYTDVFDLQPDTVYYYWLEDMDMSGKLTLHGPTSTQSPALLLLNRIYLPAIRGGN